jgi:hypothetical protein
MGLPEGLSERWGLPIEYDSVDSAQEDPSIDSYGASRDDIWEFDWTYDHGCTSRLASAIQAYGRTTGVDEVVHLGAEHDWFVRPLKALAPADVSALDFPSDFSWVVDGATVAGEPILSFLRDNWADFRDTKQGLLGVGGSRRSPLWKRCREQLAFRLFPSRR